MKKIIALFLALLMLFGMAACGTTAQTETPAETEAEPVLELTTDDYGIFNHPNGYEGELPLVKEGEPNKVTFGINTTANCTDYDDNAYFNWVEEQTGVDIEVVPFGGSSSDAATQISLMTASKEKLPDVLLSFGGINKATYNEYGVDGYFIDLGEYLSTEAYWLNDSLHKCYPTEKEYDDIMREIMGYIQAPATGEIYGFPTLFQNPTDTMLAHMWINQQWLENLGLQAPTTVEELYDVLVAFRDNDPNGNGKKDEIPMVGRADAQGYSVTQCIINAFIYCSDKYRYIINDGVVSAPYDQDEYRQALIYMKKLVDEKLLDPMSWTAKAPDIDALMNPDDNVYTVGIAVCPGDTIFENGGDSVFAYEPLAPFKAATDKGGYGVTFCDYIYGTTHITADCENPELAFKLLDFMSGMECIVRQRWGIEGQHWEYMEPKENAGNLGGTARIKILDSSAFDGTNNYVWHGQFGMNSEAYWQYELDVNDGSWNGTLYKKLQQQKQNYVDAGQPEEQYFNISRTDEEEEIWSDANADITEYIRTSRANFCNGITDPNNDADWQNYLNDLYSLNYEQWISIAQAYYDRTH